MPLTQHTRQVADIQRVVSWNTNRAHQNDGNAKYMRATLVVVAQNSRGREHERPRPNGRRYAGQSSMWSKNKGGSTGGAEARSHAPCAGGSWQKRGSLGCCTGCSVRSARGSHSRTGLGRSMAHRRHRGRTARSPRVRCSSLGVTQWCVSRASPPLASLTSRNVQEVCSN